MSKPDIYRQHDSAFANVSAFVIVHGAGEKVATIAIKFPKDGVGRLYAYVHWCGIRMVRGTANGYGYDKRSAAIADAMSKLPAELPSDTYDDGTPHHSEHDKARYAAFRQACATDDGLEWDRRLRDAGFEVWQAV
jgi:hypothetical protein